VQRIAKSDPIEPIIMSTKDTIRIVLNGGADEHTVDLGGEQCVSVYVVDGKLKCQVQGVGDGQVIKKPAAPGIRPGCQMRGFGGAGQLTSFYLKLEESRKKIEQLEREKDAILKQLAAVLEQKDTADTLLLDLCKNDYVRRLAEERSAEHSTARTELEARCFAPPCRVWLIRRDLKAFVASMGSKWEKRDWCIAWKIFDDLRWWTGNEMEFARWVAELGYDMGEFKQAKKSCRKRYGEACFDRWHDQVHGTDHFAVVARGLAALFVGSPAKPASPTYEESYMDHTALHRTMGRSQAGTQGTRAHIYIDCPEHDDHARRRCNKYGKHRAKLDKEGFIVAVARHKMMGTLGRGNDTPAGMSLHLQAVVHTPRARRARTLHRESFLW